MVLTSTDGATWTQLTTGTASQFGRLAYNGARYVTADFSGILTSTNLTVWTAVAGTTSERYSGLAYGNGRFVALTFDRRSVTSTDVITWTVNSLPTTYSIYTVQSVGGQLVARGSGAGNYACVVSNSFGSTTSAAAALTLSFTTDFGRIVNLSILTSLSAADPLFTVGTVIGDAPTSGSKSLLIRAAGPPLTPLGVSGVLADPKLEVFSGQTSISTNDNWAGTAALSAAFTSVGAFAYVNAASLDAAIYNPAVPAGGYTVQDTGGGGAIGIGHRRWLLYPADARDRHRRRPRQRHLRRSQRPLDSRRHPHRPAPRHAHDRGPLSRRRLHALSTRLAPLVLQLPRRGFFQRQRHYDPSRRTAPARIEPLSTGIGENTLVWVYNNLDSTFATPHPRPSADTTYTVNVNGVRIAGTPWNFSYNVTVFDPDVPGGDYATTTINGTSAPPSVSPALILGRNPPSPTASSIAPSPSPPSPKSTTPRPASAASSPPPPPAAASLAMTTGRTSPSTKPPPSARSLSARGRMTPSSSPPLSPAATPSKSPASATPPASR